MDCINRFISLPTPELSGEDAERLIRDVMRKRDPKTIERNLMLADMVQNMRKNKISEGEI